MATFRQDQIEEILNYDRAMNRIVLDNEIGQATRFNDERKPPSNRDIKFEALLGTLVDSLKAKIAEALTSIAAQQYPKTDATKVTRLLGMDSREQYRNMNNEARKKSKKQEEQFQENAKKVSDAEIEERRKTYRDRDVDLKDDDKEAEDKADAGAPKPQLSENIVSGPVKSGIPLLDGQGRPSKIRKFHLKGFGGVDPPAGAEAEPDRTGTEQEKSVRQTTNATENILYEIVIQYNGIIDKILQVTQPDGRFASKRTAAASSIGYFADVLRGLLEPLRHLEFELNQVHKPQLASMINMMKAVGDLIDVSPPFQKINIGAYKSGLPDFQGLTGEIVHLNVPAYVADLKAYLEKVKGMLNQAIHQSQSMQFNMHSKALKDRLQKSLDDKVKHFEQLKDKVAQEIENVAEREKVTGKFEVDAEIIKELEKIYEATEQLIIDGPRDDVAIWDTYDNEFTLFPPKRPEENIETYISRLKASIRKTNTALKVMEDVRRDDNLNRGDDLESDERFDKLTNQKGELQNQLKIYQEQYNFLKSKQITYKEFSRRIDETLPKGRKVGQTRKQVPVTVKDAAEAELARRNEEFFAQKYPIYKPPTQEEMDAMMAELDEGIKSGEWNNLREVLNQALIPHYVATALSNKFLRPNGIIVPHNKGTKRIIEALKTFVNNKKEGKGRGGSGGLADLLSNDAQQQYWHHRPNDQYEFDEQHRELMASDRKWQSLSNPPHTAPIGHLYPFYKKDEASMYSFPLKLKNENAKKYPDDTQRTARGADISLLQGPMGSEVREKMPPKRKSTVIHRTAKEATNNILEGNGRAIDMLSGIANHPQMKVGRGSVEIGGYNPWAKENQHKVIDSINRTGRGGYRKYYGVTNQGAIDAINRTGRGRKNPKALHKLLFNDEGNDPYENNEYDEEGMIHTESESEEEDRFRNKKLGPKKKKSVKK